MVTKRPLSGAGFQDTNLTKSGEDLEVSGNPGHVLLCRIDWIASPIPDPQNKERSIQRWAVLIYILGVLWSISLVDLEESKTVRRIQDNSKTPRQDFKIHIVWLTKYGLWHEKKQETAFFEAQKMQNQWSFAQYSRCLNHHRVANKGSPILTVGRMEKFPIGWMPIPNGPIHSFGLPNRKLEMERMEAF